MYPLMTASGARIVLFAPDPLPIPSCKYVCVSVCVCVWKMQRTATLHARFPGHLSGVIEV